MITNQKKFKIRNICDFVISGPNIAQVSTPIISLTRNKSCWAVFVLKIFYHWLNCTLHTSLPTHKILNLHCNIFTKLLSPSSDFILLKDHSIFTDEIYFLSKEIHFDEHITWVKNFWMWGKNIVIPHHPILSTWKTSLVSILYIVSFG